jgi:5-methyltetrahydrofolate--homocysteine methyltransferase
VQGDTVTGSAFTAAASRGRLLLDGAMATFVHPMRAAPGDVPACDDLSLSDPALVRRVHDAYLEAGADIVRTNTFRAAARHHTDAASQLCAAAARLAREAADAWTARTPARARLVAGAVGPADERGPHERVRTAYRAPLRALLEGGVDLVLLETCCHPAQAAAALAAVADAEADTGRHVPVVLSMTLDTSGRLAVSGASIDDLLAAIDPAAVAGLGVNCGAGPHELQSALAALRRHSALVTCHPSAGLPGADGRHPIAPDDFARQVARYTAAGLADVVGGCCGTTPAHVAALAHAGSQ